MELHLQPSADVCFVTGAGFQPGDRVASFLVRDEQGEFRRFDCLASAETEPPPGEVLCRWTRTFKPRVPEVNAERELRLTAESLFLSLTEEGGEAIEENAALKQFLALMLERKRVLKNRGRSPDGGRTIYEHARTKRMIEVPAGEMDAAFFVSVREKLGVLLGDKAPTSASSEPEPDSSEEPPAETEEDSSPAGQDGSSEESLPQAGADAQSGK